MVVKPEREQGENGEMCYEQYEQMAGFLQEQPVV